MIRITTKETIDMSEIENAEATQELTNAAETTAKASIETTGEPAPPAAPPAD